MAGDRRPSMMLFSAAVRKITLAPSRAVRVISDQTSFSC
jgi:hypothetical protein